MLWICICIQKEMHNIIIHINIAQKFICIYIYELINILNLVIANIYIMCQPNSCFYFFYDNKLSTFCRQLQITAKGRSTWPFNPYLAIERDMHNI